MPDNALVASGRRRAILRSSPWRAVALLVFAALPVAAAMIVVIVEGGTSTYWTQSMSGIAAPWTIVLGAVGLLACLGLAAHSIRGLRTGRLRMSQTGVGSVVVDPWSRTAALEASVALRNSDRSTALQPASVEIVRYRLDGAKHRRRIVGRVVTKSTRPLAVEPRSEGEARVRFSVPMAMTNSVVAADVVLRDEFYRKARARLRFEDGGLPRSAPRPRRWRSD